MIHEGRNRIVRRLLDARRPPRPPLTRTAHRPGAIGRLRSGELRDLTLDELGVLLDRAEL